MAQALQKRGLVAIAIQADVAQEESVKALVQGRVRSFQAPGHPGQQRRHFPDEAAARTRRGDLGPHEWESIFAGPTSARGTPPNESSRETAGGRIINISTINTARTYLGMAHYDASKYGLNALTKASALEYAPFGITVNAIAPGAVKTPGSLKVRSELGGGSVEAADAEFAKRIPLGRWAEPEDIGRAVLCLTGRAADYITGQIIYADGGLMLGF